MMNFKPGIEKDESKYARLIELSKCLGIPCVSAHISVSSGDQSISRRSRTWNRNFWNIHQLMICSGTNDQTNWGDGYLNFKKFSDNLYNHTSNFSSGTSSLGNFTPYWGGTVLDDFGIVAGTGTAAESFEGGQLASKITHGTGAGQLDYTSQVTPSLSYVAGTKTWTNELTRLLANTSGGTIGINEIALVVKSYTSTSAEAMISRDVLGSTINVANGQNVVIKYTFSLTFPA